MSEFVLTSELLDRAGIRHGFTTRHLGDVLHDMSGWERESKLSRGSLVRLKQVHETDVLVVDGAVHELPPEDERRFDVSVTDRNDVILSIRTADCVPVLLYSSEPRAIAGAHAGWRGTLNGTVGCAVSALEHTYGCRAGDLLAVMGPCIHSCCYRVGPDVYEPFLERFGTEVAVELHVDLVAANRHWLLESGVEADNIDVLDFCTHCRADLFFSYRREGPTGRQLAYITL